MYGDKLGLLRMLTPKLLILYQQINTSQTDPNALKHEIKKCKYFTTFEPYQLCHLAENLSDEQFPSMKSSMEQHFRISYII